MKGVDCTLWGGAVLGARTLGKSSEEGACSVSVIPGWGCGRARVGSVLSTWPRPSFCPSRTLPLREWGAEGRLQDFRNYRINMALAPGMFILPNDVMRRTSGVSGRSAYPGLEPRNHRPLWPAPCSCARGFARAPLACCAGLPTKPPWEARRH